MPRVNTFVVGESKPIVPPGVYKAIFFRHEYPPPHRQYGQGIKLVFSISEGEYKGCEVSRLMNGEDSPTKNNALGKFLMAMVGKEVAPGDSIDVQKCVGLIYSIEMEKQPNSDFTRIKRIVD